MKIQTLVDQANEAVEATRDFGYGMMDKEGNSYRLLGPAKLMKNGILVIPFPENMEDGKYHVFSRAGGKYRLVPNDSFNGDGWGYAQKALKKVIADAERFLKDMQGYDPNWEDEENPNNKAIRDFNKSIGVKAGARQIRENRKNMKRINESQLRAIVAESVKKILKEEEDISVRHEMENIYHSAVKICKALAYTEAEDYEPDGEAGYDDSGYIRQWAEKVVSDTEGYLYY